MGKRTAPNAIQDISMFGRDIEVIGEEPGPAHRANAHCAANCQHGHCRRCSLRCCQQANGHANQPAALHNLANPRHTHTRCDHPVCCQGGEIADGKLANPRGNGKQAGIGNRQMERIAEVTRQPDGIPAAQY